MPKKAPKAYDMDLNTRTFQKTVVEKKPWVCTHEECAYENDDPDTEECDACGEERYPDLPTDGKLGSKDEKPGGK